MTYIQDPDRGWQLFPVPASTAAGGVDLLFYVLLAVSVLMSLVVAALVVYFGIRYRKGAAAPRKPPPGRRATHAIEIAWASTLLVLFMALFAWGARDYLDFYRVPREALSIAVVGKQWMWKLQHPDGTREINTLHVPTGRNIRLDISSQDVIHSFYVPAFRLKRDAVPGARTSAWFKATEPGEYHLYCAEYCGTDHSRMRGKVVVMAPAAYQAWLERQGQGPSPAVAGKRLFSTYGCAGCHQGESAVRAPGLAGIYGRTVPLASGATATADEAYLRDSILLPDKHVVAGYEPLMPSFAGRIGEADLQRLIAYIKSLEAGDWEREP